MMASMFSGLAVLGVGGTGHEGAPLTRLLAGVKDFQ
jgi:hypothetical protein